MRQIIKFLLFSLLATSFLSGCNSNNTNANEDIFQLKDSFVGDNNAVVNIANQLPGTEHLNDFELKTNEEPYGIIINYDWIESELNGKETSINNASYLFSLIQNVDWITFNFEMVDGMKEYKITRENLQGWYGIELNEIDNEDKLKELIQESLENEEKVDQLFN